MDKTIKTKPVSATKRTKHGVYSINTVQANARFSRELHRKGELRAAHLGGLTYNDYLRRLVELDTRNIQLSAEDYRIIAERIEHEQSLRAARGL